MSNEKRKFLTVKVREGMFTNEYAVEVFVSGNLHGSLFVDKNIIVTEGSQNLLPLSSVVESDLNSYWNVLLPSEILENGSRWVTVPKRELIEK